MSNLCPNGHTSTDSEWCDTCGAPMVGAAPRAASTPSSPTPTSPAPPTAVAPVSCPHCGAMNSADNLFCESCGYDFTTGQVPEAVRNQPPSPDPVAVAPAGTWVVIVEVDPVWHALKGDLADRSLPAASTSTVPITQHASMIGRTSQSRGVRPEVALDADTAVSRRHAQLIFEDDRLSVVDLSSTNGTYVVDRDVVPTADAAPLAAGVAAVLDDGDQIFLGAWSRLTVRRA